MKNNFYKNLILKRLSILMLLVYFTGIGNIKVNAAANDTLDDTNVGSEEIINSSFKNDLQGWTIEAPENVAGWKSWGQEGDGTGALGYWSNSSYEADTHQTITGLENGKYKIQAYVSSGGIHNELYMYAKNSSGEEIKTDIGESGDFTKIALEVEVTTSSGVIVGFHSDAQENAWANFDDISIDKVEEAQQEEVTSEVINPSFKVNLDEWTIEAPENVATWKTWGQEGEGTGALGYWSDSSYVADTHQTITGLKSGKYKIEAYACSGGKHNKLYMYAKNSSGEELKTDIEEVGNFTKIAIEVEVETGSDVTIGFYSDAQGNAWANFDDVSITKVEETQPEETQPEEATGEVINPEFENNLDGWTTEDPEKIAQWQSWGDGGNDSGSLGYKWCPGESYEVNTHQTITELENGTYIVQAYVATGGGQSELYMYVKDFDEDDSKKEVKESLPKAKNFRLTTLEVKVTNNQMTIGFYSKGGPEEWANFDKVTITPKELDNRVSLDKIFNSSFADELSNWKIIGDSDAVLVKQGIGYDDDKYLGYSSDKNYEVRTEQTITGLENGDYRLEVYAASSGGQDNIYAYAKDFGAGEARTSIPVDNQFRKVVVNFKVKNNQATIGFYSKAPKDSWTNFDDVKLFKAKEGYELLKGGDLTEVNYIENAGGVFYDNNGKPGDVFHILADNGLNFARLRIYNKTGRDNSHVYEDGSEYYLPDGYQDKEDILKLAKRAKNVGMQSEISLHYSDWWSNADNQDIPSEWKKEIEGLDNDAAVNKLEELVYEYTKDVMQSLKDQGTTPEYISLGNEMQHGILYPYGSINNMEQFGRFINAGYKAVKEVNKDTAVILHLDEAGDNARYYKLLDGCEEYDINYDIIGASYYPFWTRNTVEQIIPWFNNISKRYNKKIMIMETGYNWNETIQNGKLGQLSDTGTESHAATPQGQKEFMDELFNGIRNAENNCIIGDLYWDPIMIYNKNVGWAIEKGKAEDGSEDKVGDNVISNTTLFDFEGKALKTLVSYTDNTEGIAAKYPEKNNTEAEQTNNKRKKKSNKKEEIPQESKVITPKGLHENEDGTISYYDESGNKLKNTWVEFKGKRYLADSQGVMIKGWINIKGSWYYLNNDGSMKIGWLNDNGKWYCLNNDGSMKIGWLNDNGKWYCLNNDGSMKTSWLNDNGIWYYLNNDGSMKTGWLNDNGVWYYLNNNGSMKNGWLNENETWYYLDGLGKMVTNSIIDGYRLNEDGKFIN